MTTPAHTRPYLSLAVWLAAAAAMLAAPAPVRAQAPAGESRAFITVNGGLQALTSSFSEDIVFAEAGGPYRPLLSSAAAQEQARLQTDYRFRSGPVFDGGAAVRVAPYFALGIGVSRFDVEETASVSAQVPHPLFFDRDRSISGDSPPLTRRETAVHLQALVVMPATSSFTVTVFGGPTLFEVEQQLVTDVNFTHAYPYNTADFSDAVASPQSADTVGFNVGADIAYYFTGNLGVGWLTRYSRAMVEVPSAGGETLDIEVGGLHTALGLRVRF